MDPHFESSAHGRADTRRCRLRKVLSQIGLLTEITTVNPVFAVHIVETASAAAKLYSPPAASGPSASSPKNTLMPLAPSSRVLGSIALNRTGEI